MKESGLTHIIFSAGRQSIEVCHVVLKYVLSRRVVLYQEAKVCALGVSNDTCVQIALDLGVLQI